MAKQTTALVTFNRGVVDRKALARTSVARIQSSAEQQTNWYPQQLGPMSLRPGTEFIGYTRDEDLPSTFLEFVFSATETALIELERNTMRIWQDDELLTRPAVTAQLDSPDFTQVGADADWTDRDETGADSDLGSSGMVLIGDKYASARRYQALTINEVDTLHSITINVSRYHNSPLIRIGTEIGADDILRETTLHPGVHQLTFTPTEATVYVEFEYRGVGKAELTDATIFAGGTVVISTFQLRFTARSASRRIRYVQSGDIIYITNIDDYVEDDTTDDLFSNNVIMAAIERRANDSWSLVEYRPIAGPYFPLNTTDTRIRATAIAGTGTVTLTADKDMFEPGHLGALFRLESTGQMVSLSLTGADQFTDAIRVVGIEDSRVFVINIAGTWSGNITLQRSVGVEGIWDDVTDYNANHTDLDFDDGYDNSIIFYRLGFKSGDYTSGTADVSLDYPNGSITGLFRVSALVGFPSAPFAKHDEVIATIIQSAGNSEYTQDWSEGMWSKYRGFPSCVEIHEGRLWFAGKDRIWGSVSDNYYNFDDVYEGDAGPLNRSVGYGPVDSFEWLKSKNRLFLGGQIATHVIRSSATDEPITPSVFSLKRASTVGNEQVQAHLVDNQIIQVQNGGRRVFELKQSGTDVAESESTDITILCPKLFNIRIQQLAVQRRPETRIYAVLSDGTAVVLIYNQTEEIRAWVPVNFGTDLGRRIVTATVVPREEYDDLYWQINDTVAGTRYIVKMVNEDECIGGEISKLADAFVEYSGVSTTTITGMDHIADDTPVVAWAHGVGYTGLTVSGGSVTLPVAVTSAVVGLPYRARYKSTKLAYGVGEQGTALNQPKRVTHIGLVAENIHPLALKYGPDFTRLEYMPEVEREEVVDLAEVAEEYDEPFFPFDGEWDTDSRVCLEANAPYPVTVIALAVAVKTNEKE